MPLRKAGKRQMIPLAVESQYRQQTKATWKYWNLSLKAPTVFHGRQLLQKSESLQRVYRALTNNMGKRNVCAKWIPHVLIDYQRSMSVWCDFDHASSLICGNKMPTRCNRWFLLQILLLDQHVSGTITPIIRSSRVLYRWLPPVVFGALVSKLSVWCGAEGYMWCPKHVEQAKRSTIKIICCN